MRDKHFCEVLEAIHRMFKTIADRKQLNTDAKNGQLWDIEEDLKILEREILGMGGGVE